MIHALARAIYQPVPPQASTHALGIAFEAGCDLGIASVSGLLPRLSDPLHYLTSTDQPD